MPVLTPHELSPVEEEPDDSSIANIPAYRDSHTQPTIEELTIQGETAYKRATALQALHGLVADTVTEYRQAASALIAASALEAKPQGDVPDDTLRGIPEVASLNPLRDMVIAECLGEQARATDITPYKDRAYQPGGMFELIEVDELGADGKNKRLTPHQYLQWLSGQYLLRASVTLMGEDNVALAGELTAESTAEAIAEASDEAASDVDLPIQDYLLPSTDSHNDTAVTEAIDPDLVKQSIKANTEQDDKGAEYTVRMAEIVREKFGADTEELSFGPELYSPQAGHVIPRPTQHA